MVVLLHVEELKANNVNPYEFTKGHLQTILSYLYEREGCLGLIRSDSNIVTKGIVQGLSPAMQG